jgi:hypothetical protein
MARSAEKARAMLHKWVHTTLREDGNATAPSSGSTNKRLASEQRHPHSLTDHAATRQTTMIHPTITQYRDCARIASTLPSESSTNINTVRGFCWIDGSYKNRPREPSIDEWMMLMAEGGGTPSRDHRTAQIMKLVIDE